MGGERDVGVEFARLVSGVPAVVAVSHAEEGQVHLFWTFIKQRDKAVRKDIYELERRLMLKYHDQLFDFHVVALGNTEPTATLVEDLQGRLVYYKD